MALIDKLSAIGDAIRAKTGKTALLTLDQMPTEIAAIETGGGGGSCPAVEVTGDCSSRFANGKWDNLINNHKIITYSITSSDKMFQNSSALTEIPFELNGQGVGMQMFYGCTSLKKPCSFGAWKITGSVENMFYNCSAMESLPEGLENCDWSAVEGSNSAADYMFFGCNALRAIPTELLAHLTMGASSATATSYEKKLYYYGFYNCWDLDEIVGLPTTAYSAVESTNSFVKTFENCRRLKRVTFALNEDGTPKTCSWRSHAIDLTTVGFGTPSDNMSANGKKVIDTTTYAAYKNDPDWWSPDSSYSRYNHDSAVETINTLPDASSNNTIKFLGAAGALTDGGAINTLTEEEIAVAAAKGWTVALS